MDYKEKHQSIATWVTISAFQLSSIVIAVGLILRAIFCLRWREV
jgi:hypothetical protein